MQFYAAVSQPKYTPNVFCRGTNKHTHTHIFTQYSGISSHSKEFVLVMCMPFDFINGLKNKKWTCIDPKWLARLIKHLKKAQSSNIKQIRFIRHIGRLDIYDNSREYDIEDDATYMRSF
jgi:hypothetical protein